MINRFVILVNFRNHFDDALTKKAYNAGPYPQELKKFPENLGLYASMYGQL